MSPVPVFTLAAAFVGAAGALAATPAVTAKDAWCRATPPSPLSAGCYVTLTARADDRLVAVDTTAGDHAEIHTMDMAGGVMRMRRLADGVALPAARSVALKPGSHHLMIIRPKGQLKAGDVVPMTLRFAKGPPVRLEIPVRNAQAASAGRAHNRGGRE